MTVGLPPFSYSTELLPSRETLLPLLSKIDKEVHITKVKNSIYLPLQEASLSLPYKMDVQVQITKVEKLKSSQSKEVAHSFFEIHIPHPSIVFSRASQLSILISTPSPSFLSLGTVSTPLKLSLDTYDPFQILLIQNG